MMHKYFWPIAAMCLSVTLSNILVNYRVHWFGLGDILTYGAFTYPFAFLISDLSNRRYGAYFARHIVYAGFFVGVVISFWLAGPRIAVAAGAAFLFGQLCDIFVFTPLRHRSWWQAPLAAAFAGSILDTLLFFSIAFAPVFSFLDSYAGVADSSLYQSAVLFGLTVPLWVSLALGDFCIKLIMAVAMLLPYRIILGIFVSKCYINKKNIRIYIKNQF